MTTWKEEIFKFPEVYQRTLSDFSLLSHIGNGAMSVVFLVRDRFSGKKMAMKAMDKKGTLRYHDSLCRIVDERIVHARMHKHPYILEMSHAFETESTLFVATEHCSRGDLFHYLKEHGRKLSEAKAKAVAAEVLLALETLHDQGILYRDLKPENVMVADDGHVKLGDFGAAKITNRRQAIPRTNSAVGTVQYLAPGMARYKAYNRSEDLWAFGIFICELLNGETPFVGETDQTIYSNIKNAPLVLPLTMSVEARDLARRLLHRNPSKRLGTGINGWEEVKAHRWFKELNWQILLLQPPVRGPLPAYADENKSLSQRKMKMNIQSTRQWIEENVKR